MPQDESANLSTCPRCKRKRKIYSIRRDNARCSTCLYEWHPGKLPTHMEPEQWRRLLAMFLQNKSSSAIAARTGQNIKQVLRAVGYIRTAMASEIPGAFNEIAPDISLIRFDQVATDEMPRFGILSYKNHLWFCQAKDSKQTVEPVTGMNFSAFIDKNTFEVVDKDASIRNQLESFWDSQKEFLTGRSGHRSEKLGLYLAQAIWRHNHRKQGCASLVEHLLKLIGQAWNLRNKK